MSKPVIKIARRGFDALTSSLKDLAFTTDLTLLKFFKSIRSTTEQSIEHGLSYKPVVFFMREITSAPKKMAHYSWVSNYPLLDGPSVTDSDVVFKKGKYTPSWTGSYLPPVDDAATIAILAIDPLGTPGSLFQSKQSFPIIKVGTQPVDTNKALHSRYDTLKVFRSGEIIINIPEWVSNNTADVDTKVSTINHGLGYIPFFSPFVPFSTSMTEYYGWLLQWHNQHTWANSTEYIPKDNVEEPASSGNFFECTKRHTSTSNTKPGSGAQWGDYWKIMSKSVWSPIPSTININELEDIKVVYGGVGGFGDETLRFYATSTQLVVEYERWTDHTWDPGPIVMPARTLILSYTIFYNRVDEEFDLLTS